MKSTNENPNVREDPEWKYRYEERLGILCGGSVPTVEQKKIATQEADEAMRQLAVDTLPGMG